MGYTLVEGIAWEPLDGEKVLLGVSRNWLTFELKDGTLLKCARGVKPGHRQAAVPVEANGQPPVQTQQRRGEPDDATDS
jgi:hypothetical protein